MKKKSILALALAALMALALSACAPKDDGKTGGEDPTAALANAQKLLSEVESMESKMVLDMDLEIEVEGQKQAMKTKVSMDMLTFQKPATRIKATMSTEMDMGTGPQAMNIEMYIVENDGALTLYSGIDGQWGEETLTLGDLAQYDPQASMDLYLNSGSNFKNEGSEKLGEIQTTKFSGVITGEAMNEVIVASGVLDSMESLPVDGIDLAALYAKLGDLPMSIWVDEAGYPVRYEMDMTAMMKGIYDEIFAQMGMAEQVTLTCDKALMSMDCSNFNKVAPFELPAELAA